MGHSVSPDLLYGISGFCVGVLVGMTGVGGGSLMTPLLILLFGVHPTTAVGIDLLFAASTKAGGTIVHSAARTVDWMLVSVLAIGSVPATITTLVLLSRFDLKGVVVQHIITVTLGGVLLVTAIFLSTGKSIRTRYADRLNRLDPRTVGLFTVALGLTMGVLVTITSVGAGATGGTVLLLLHPKMPPGRIVGSDIAHGVPLTLLAGAGHWYLGSVDWSLLGSLLVGVVRMTLAGILVIVGVRLLG